MPQSWYPRLSGLVPSPVEEAFRIAYDNLYKLRDSLASTAQSIPPAGPTLAQIQAALQLGGTNPLNLSGLVGSALVLSGTHAQRLGTSPAINSARLFIETDRGNALYYSTGLAWSLVYGRVNVTQAQIAALGLGVPDKNLLLNVTDFAHVLEWNGTALAWGPGDLGSGMLAVFEIDPGVGWALYDGSTVSYLKSDGTLGSVVLQDLTSAPGKAAFLVGGSPNSAVNVAVVPVDSGPGTVVQSGAGTTVATHTHTHAGASPQNLVRRAFFRQ